MSVFEAGMLLCFGLAWPINIYKSHITKTAKGKSPLFLAVVWIGYVSGIVHKILYNMDIVFFLYCINIVMVSIDFLLYLRNKRLDKQADLG